jgi:type I restriction enzyme S subunit
MKYQTYPAYKDSGVEWLGDVPEHWNLNRFKNIFRIRKRIAGKLGFNVLSITQKGVKVKDTESGDGQLSMDYSKYQLVYQGDYAMNHMDLLTGFVDISHYDGVTSPDYRVFTLEDKNSNKSYYLYLLQLCYIAKIFYPLGQGAANIGRWRLPSEAFHEFIAPLPNLDEQQKIAQFLDHETAKIDTLIEKQQRLIELLKEKRQAVISHAVTKGLNPNAPMKESGVEWLGDVPEGWVVNNITYIFNAIGDVDHYMPQSVENGIPYVMTGDLKEFVSGISFKDCKQVSHEDYVKLSQKIKSSKGDLIVARYATIGTASYVDIDTDFLVSYSCVTIKPNPSKVFGLYLFYYFKSNSFLQGIQNQINTNTQGNVGISDLKKVKMALPTLDEQSKIIEFLDKKVSKVDTLIEKSNSAIELMQERRTALISAAVTGKIDVRNFTN